MNQAENLISVYDTSRLLKRVLTHLIRKYDLSPTSDSVDAYNSALWEYIRSNGDLSPLTDVLEHIFAGKTGVIWCRFDDPEAVGRAVEHLKNEGTQYYEGVIEIPPEELEDGEAYVVGASSVRLAEDEVELVRFRVKSGRFRQTDGMQIWHSPRISPATMLLNPRDGYIEIRTSEKLVTPLFERIGRLIAIPLGDMVSGRVRPLADSIEDLADALGGVTVGTTSRPEQHLQQFSEEQIKAIIDLLDGLGVAIREVDATQLLELIDEYRLLLDDVATDDLPLSVLLLGGFQKIGLTAQQGRDVRDGALYRWTRRIVQHSKGLIHFSVDEEGEQRTHGIMVGTTMNSVTFTTKATETAIRHVRKVLFDMVDNGAV